MNDQNKDTSSINIPDPDKVRGWWGLIRDITNAVDGQIKRLNLLWMYQRSYSARLKEKVETQTVYGKSKLVRIKDFYVKARILDRVERDELRDEEFITKELQSKTMEMSNSEEIKGGLEIIQNEDKVFLLGKPGSGKSTFLQYIAFSILDDQFESKRIPILISLKDWFNKEIEGNKRLPLLDYLVIHFESFHLYNMKSFLTRQLKKGNCFLLLDGLDETTDKIEDAINRIREFTDQNNKNRFVISCRFAATGFRFKSFTNVEIVDLDPEQQKSFVKNWFIENNTPEIGDECWTQLEQRKEIQELASTPLLLCMLCIAFNPQTKTFPAKRSDLFHESLMILLEKWDEHNAVTRYRVYEELLVEERLVLLSTVAVDIFVDRSSRNRRMEQYDVSPLIVNGEKLKEYVAKAYCAIKGEEHSVDSESIIRAIEAMHGLLIERSLNKFSFNLVSIQEYLVAEWFIKENKLQTLVDEYLHENHWRQVFLLVSEKLEEADDFFSIMRNRVHLLATGEQIQLLNELDQAILVELPQMIFFNRLLALYAITLDDELKSYIQVFIRLHSSLCLIPFVQIDSRMFLDEKKIPLTAKSEYLTASLLLFECLQTKCSIPESIKQKLLDSLLMEEDASGSQHCIIDYPNILIKQTETPQANGRNVQTIKLPNLPDNAVPLQMVYIPNGEFKMGSHPDDGSGYKSEHLQRVVTIENDFYMGMFQVTQAQWQSVMEKNPSRFSENPNHPVERVTWNDCHEFLNRLSEITKEPFRLPSEAEWEYACRAGKGTRFYWGDDSNSKSIWNYAWYYGNSFGSTQPVGLKNPNKLGLYDMSGNVWEWCEDDWHNNYEGAPTDGSAWVDSPRGSGRVIRGGSWGSNVWFCRSANRDGWNPDYAFNYLGFRIVLSRTQ